MCLVLLAYRSHPRYPLILLANRDERFDRPAQEAGFWEDQPHILGGRDLSRMGTWLGISRGGKVAAVTYYREPPSGELYETSRGHLVSEYLAGERTGEHPFSGYAETLEAQADRYDGYNLIYGAFGEGEAALAYASNRGPSRPRLEPGIYGLSNGLLDEPWPKVRAGKAALRAQLEASSGGPLEPEALLSILRDPSHPSDPELPDTGFGLPLERLLAPIFIEPTDRIRAPGAAGERYGTRASTALLLDHEGHAVFAEENHIEGTQRRFKIRLEPA